MLLTVYFLFYNEESGYRGVNWLARIHTLNLWWCLDSLFLAAVQVNLIFWKVLRQEWYNCLLGAGRLTISAAPRGGSDVWCLGPTSSLGPRRNQRTSLSFFDSATWAPHLLKLELRNASLGKDLQNLAGFWAAWGPGYLARLGLRLGGVGKKEKRVFN